MKTILTLIVAMIMTTNASAQQCNNQCETSCTKKLLLLVDVQYDFINGSLAVSGAPAVMDSLAAYIAEQPAGTFSQIVMTADFHPYNHSSFKDNGGMWPVHCVAYSHGASIYQPVFEAVNKQIPCSPVLTKGDNVAVDEYSIMANADSAKKLLRIIEENGIQEIYVAGLCGDYCVGNSIKDLVQAGHGEKIRVLTRFIGNIDDGTTLRNIIKDNNLQER
ncbi:MAG: isochorismatase family protein [Prevotella sp.]|nr:isochorismatase family protein [Prevotella sp.]